VRGIAAAAVGAVVAGCGDAGPAGTGRGTPSAGAAEDGRASTSGASVPEVSGAAKPVALPAEVSRAETGRDEVALTFHGQGEPAQVERLLGVLEKAGARVTVLVVGTWLGEYPSMARRVLAGGHELGNHTENHLDMSEMDAAAAYAEISACADRLRALTGSQGRWFRPSQTQYATAVVKEQAVRAGYPTCLSFSLDSRDHTEPGPPVVVRNVLGKVRAGDVVSLHFGHDGTTVAMPQILAGLQEKGLRPVTAGELFGPARG
jgi:peptidoglycan/xylan/chitin deacetylase (PgdA/CDA1 family)